MIISYRTPFFYKKMIVAAFMPNFNCCFRMDFFVLLSIEFLLYCVFIICLHAVSCFVYNRCLSVFAVRSLHVSSFVARFAICSLHVTSFAADLHLFKFCIFQPIS